MNQPIKTPEEIKNGLECYINHGECEKHPGCNGCPFKVYTAGDVLKNAPIRDALALIQQIEAKDIKQAQRIADLEQELADVKRERDAAKSDLCNAEPCFTCLHFRRNGGDCGGGSACREAMGECIELNREYTGNVYEWRGVCPGNTEVQEGG